MFWVPISFKIGSHCSQVGPHLGTLVPMGTKMSILVPIFSFENNIFARGGFCAFPQLNMITIL